MIRFTLKTCPTLFLCLLVFCSKIHAFVDTIPASISLSTFKYPLYFLDEKEIDYPVVKKLDPKAIEKIESQKGADAVRRYGVRARFGVIKITSRKGISPLQKNGMYSFTVYIMKDSAKHVMQMTHLGSNLDTMFRQILDAYPNSKLLIDNLRSNNFQNSKFLEILPAVLALFT